MKLIFHSNSSLLLEKEIENKLKENKILKENLFVFDYEANQLNDAFFQYLSKGILVDKKLIVLKNANFLKIKNQKKNFLNYFSDFLNAKSENLLILHVENLNLNGDFYKTYKDKFTLIEKKTQSGKGLNLAIENYLKDNQINYDKTVIRALINTNNKNFELILRDIEKLSLLNKKLTVDLVNRYGNNLKLETAFGLLEAISKKNYQNIIKILNGLESQNINLILTLEYLINELQLILHFKYLKTLQRKGIIQTNENNLKINKFRLFKIKEFGNQLNIETITFLYNQLLNFKADIKKNNPLFQERLFKAKLLLLSKEI